MIERFCDVCGEQIRGREYRRLRMSDFDGKIPFENGENTMKDTTIDNMELCVQCAGNLKVHINVLRNRNRASKKV